MDKENTADSSWTVVTLREGFQHKDIWRLDRIAGRSVDTSWVAVRHAFTTAYSSGSILPVLAS